jgi:hypothetical protein
MASGVKLVRVFVAGAVFGGAVMAGIVAAWGWRWRFSQIWTTNTDWTAAHPYQCADPACHGERCGQSTLHPLPPISP